MTILEWLKGLASRDIRDSSATASQADDDPNIDPFDPFPDGVEVETADVIDLHTIQPREVKVVVEEYLYQAYKAGFRSVRIIHGKGIGVQREMVHSILARTPFVADWTTAPPEAGGLGATIARLRPGPSQEKQSR